MTTPSPSSLLLPGNSVDFWLLGPQVLLQLPGSAHHRLGAAADGVSTGGRGQAATEPACASALVGHQSIIIGKTGSPATFKPSI